MVFYQSLSTILVGRLHRIGKEGLLHDEPRVRQTDRGNLCRHILGYQRLS